MSSDPAFIFAPDNVVERMAAPLASNGERWGLVNFLTVSAVSSQQGWGSIMGFFQSQAAYRRKRLYIIKRIGGMARLASDASCDKAGRLPFA